MVEWEAGTAVHAATVPQVRSTPISDLMIQAIKGRASGAEAHGAGNEVACIAALVAGAPRTTLWTVVHRVRLAGQKQADIELLRDR